jgi:hypothetical protein
MPDIGQKPSDGNALVIIQQYINKFSFTFKLINLETVGVGMKEAAVMLMG